MLVVHEIYCFFLFVLLNETAFICIYYIKKNNSKNPNIVK